MNLFIVLLAIVIVIYVGYTYQQRADIWNIVFISLAVCSVAHEIGNYFTALGLLLNEIKHFGQNQNNSR